MGSNNLFFVYGGGEQVEIVTPVLGQHPGRHDPRLAAPAGQEIGCQVTERGRVVEWERPPPRGSITEVFGCGTAAVITPIGRVRHNDGEAVVGGGEPGEVTLRLRKLLTDIQRGDAADTHEWMTRLG